MPELKDVSDTALWVATFRAQESARKDALFHDPLAAMLVGEEGPRIVRSLGQVGRISGGVIVRTLAFDDFIQTSLTDLGIDAVVNIGAGLDTRPYRMDLPPSFPWWEIDLPRLLDFKEERLKNEKPRCALHRVAVDLTDERARREVLDSVAAQAERALVLTEGVLAYLDPEDVATLARELHARTSFAYWAADLIAHTLLGVTSRQKVGKQLEQAGAHFLFAPKEGVEFFKPLGWRARQVRNPILEAYRVGRVPWFMRVLKPLILRPPKEGSQMAAWAKAGLTLLERDESHRIVSQAPSQANETPVLVGLQ